MLTLEGSVGEGGGQILRTALALSLATGTPFRINRIRAGRKNPGLLRQHLTAVKAAAQVGRAEVAGDTPGSRELVFEPRGVTRGDYIFSVGTAGSATLVLQTVLPALLTASGPSHLTLEGGTHNPWAPPFDFLIKSFLPLVNRMGPRVVASLDRRGFFPAGGGRFTVSIEPVNELESLDVLDRGELRGIRAAAIVAFLPRDIASRELSIVGEKLELKRDALRVEMDTQSLGPGNVVVIEVECENATEVFTGFGERGVRAEIVATRVADDVRRYLDANVPVGEYLADQLMVPMALAGRGSFRTPPLSSHSTTNIEVIRQFLNVSFKVHPVGDQAVQVEVGPPS